MDTAEVEIRDDVMTPTSNLFDHYIINISIAVADLEIWKGGFKVVGVAHKAVVNEG